MRRRLLLDEEPDGKTLEEMYGHVKDRVRRVALKNSTFLYGSCDPPDQECKLHASCMDIETR